MTSENDKMNVILGAAQQLVCRDTLIDDSLERRHKILIHSGIYDVDCIEMIYDLEISSTQFANLINRLREIT